MDNGESLDRHLSRRRESLEHIEEQKSNKEYRSTEWKSLRRKNNLTRSIGCWR
jgi:hypothetical protein